LTSLVANSEIDISGADSLFNGIDDTLRLSLRKNSVLGLGKLSSNLKSDCVALVREVYSGYGGVDGFSDLITNIDCGLDGTKDTLSVLVLIKLEVVVLLIEVDVLVLTPPFFAIFVLVTFVFFFFIIFVLLCSLR
jgi:hypothetical protein